MVDALGDALRIDFAIVERNMVVNEEDGSVCDDEGNGLPC